MENYQPEEVGGQHLAICPEWENIGVLSNLLHITDRELTKQNQNMTHQEDFIDACCIFQYRNSLQCSEN